MFHSIGLGHGLAFSPQAAVMSSKTMASPSSHLGSAARAADCLVMFLDEFDSLPSGVGAEASAGSCAVSSPRPCLRSDQPRHGVWPRTPAPSNGGQERRHFPRSVLQDYRRVWPRRDRGSPSCPMPPMSNRVFECKTGQHVVWPVRRYPGLVVLFGIKTKDSKKAFNIVKHMRVSVDNGFQVLPNLSPGKIVSSRSHAEVVVSALAVVCQDTRDVILCRTKPVAPVTDKTKCSRCSTSFRPACNSCGSISSSVLSQVPG